MLARYRLLRFLVFSPRSGSIFALPIQVAAPKNRSVYKTPQETYRGVLALLDLAALIEY